MVERISDADPDLRTRAEGERQKHKKAKVELDIADARPPEYSDEALALRFADKHAQSARFVGVWGKWLLWTGTHWKFDSTMRTFDFARIICRIASAEITDPGSSKPRSPSPAQKPWPPP